MNFFVLTMLIVESLLGAMAFNFQEQRALLIWAILFFLLLLTIIVVGFAIWHPGGLSGEKPWPPHLANQMADDLHLSLQGAISNLTPIEQEEAWETVVDVITSHPESSKPYHVFCQALGTRLLKRAQIRKRPAPRGAISSGEDEEMWRIFDELRVKQSANPARLLFQPKTTDERTYYEKMVDRGLLDRDIPGTYYLVGC